MQNIKFKEVRDSKLLALLNEDVQMLHHTLHPEYFKPYNKEAVEEFYLDVLKNKECMPLIAYADEIVVGYALIFIKDFSENPFQYAHKYILLDQLLILKNFRKEGIGKKLLNEVFSLVKEYNITHIRLNHWVLNSNEGSSSLKMVLNIIISICTLIYKTKPPGEGGFVFIY